jgi:predicted helicase
MTAKIYHAELWGVRESKYSWLQANDINTTKWKGINPKSDFYLFIPRDEKRAKIYEKFIKITDVFPVNSVGIVTSRDDFVIDFDRDKLRRRILQFRDKRMPDEIIGQTYALKDKSNWKLKIAREVVMKDDDWEKAFTKILYRPFDERYIYYHEAVIERSLKEVMRHMLHDNLCLITNRQVLGEFRHAFCSDAIINDCTVSLETRERSYALPLYLYQAAVKQKKSLANIMMLFEPEADYSVKKPNLSAEVVERLSKAYKKTPSPEEIFYYIYAVLYSETYRTKYADFLKIDFPRVPFTKDYKLFKKMSEYGNRLVDLHLLKSQELDSPIARFQGKGDNRVEKPKYEGNSSSAVILARRESFLKKDAGQAGMTEKIKEGVTGHVYINKTQYFEGIPWKVWSYQIGGYQVCEKWLKDRKERILSLDEIQTYCRIVTAIQKTIEVQKAIHEIYGQIEDAVIK